ncbi:M48 family metalloprotease [Streptomyces abyssalis]|uniref:M48 family metalloprotease n=1 Tax=Streptomyces abyssalis TaxID=933944 RepID=UPI00099F40F4|nr:M48 family metalloprotease [Streptomyces abyssalis]
MTTAERRRDPFTVPSGTTLRFALLVLSTTAVVMSFAATRFGHGDSDEAKRRFVEYRDCWERDNRETSGFPSGDRPSAEELCGADPRLVDLWVPVTAVLVFWLVVFVIYWYLPAWRIRRRRYVRLGGELPDVARALERLRAGTDTEQVSWYVQPLNSRVSALAFGRWRRRHIVLSGGLVALRTARPEAFEAVVLHELAHVRNRDIDISFLTIAAGRAGLPVLLMTLPSGIGWELLWGTGTAASFAQGAASSLQTLCLIVVMPLARRAVLRSREFYADARAQQWNTSPQALHALFGSENGKRRLAGGLLRVHPTAARRRAMLHDTGPLFRSGFWELFAAGSVLGALYTDLTNTYMFNSALDAGADTAKWLLADFVTGTLFGGIVGFLALRSDEGFPGAAKRVLRAPAWGLGCGLALGGGLFNASIVFTLASAGQFGLGFLPWTALLAAAAFVSARWMSRTVRLWRPALRHRQRRALTLCGFVAAAGLLFACVLHWLMELMTAQALMSKILGGRVPEVVAFVLAAGMDAAARSPYLLCAGGLAALLPLLGQSLIPGARDGARRELRRTLGSGVRWGLWLAAFPVVLTFLGAEAPKAGAAGLLSTAVALVVLAVRTGRRPRDSGLAYAHAALASTVAGVLALAAAELLLTVVGCWTGSCSAPDLSRVALFAGVSAIPWSVVAACVPSARKGRVPEKAPPLVPSPFPPPVPSAVTPRARGNGMGVASLVLGITATALFWLWPIAIALGALAVIFGVIGRGSAKRGEAGNPRQALAGVVFGALGAALALAVGLAVTVTDGDDGTGRTGRSDNGSAVTRYGGA